MRKIETITKGDESTGNRVRIKIVKNKVAPPFRKVEVEIVFGKGISATGCLLDAAITHNLIQKSGSWYSYGEDKIGQGRENVKDFLEKNTDIYNEIDVQVRKLLFPETEAKAEAPEKKRKRPGMKSRALLSVNMFISE